MHCALDIGPWYDALDAPLRSHHANLFGTQVVGAACGDRSPVIQQQTLFDIDCNFGDVVSEDDALQHLSQGWES
jgi:hypothetical protein